MKNISLFISIIISFPVFGQQFMVDGKDTLPYKIKIEVVNGDTERLGSCNTFDKFQGRIINVSKVCLRQGYWRISDSSGGYSEGMYSDGNEEGTWKKYDKNGSLIEEWEEVTALHDKPVLVKDIDYSSGKAKVLEDKKFLAFYLKHIIWVFILFLGGFFVRVPINSIIYNRENGTDFSWLVFYAPFYVSKNWDHSLQCLLTFWWSNYAPESRKLAILSNILTVVSLGTFIGSLIGLAITGDLK